MARSRLHQHRWWLVMLLSLASYLSAIPQQPIRRTGIPMIHETSISPSSEIIVFLRDNCDPIQSTNEQNNNEEIIKVLKRFNANNKFSVKMLPNSVTCESKSWGLGILIEVLGQPTTKALIAALDSNTCEVAEKLAHLWEKPLLTWTCPTVMIAEENRLPFTIKLSPSIPMIAQALAEIFLHFRWKSAAIIAIDKEPWSSLDRLIVGNLRSIGIIPRHRALISWHATSNSQIYQTLWSFESIICRAIILCLPADDQELTNRVLMQLQAMRASRRDNPFFLLIHPEGPELFLPRRETLFDNSTTSTTTTTTASTVTTTTVSATPAIRESQISMGKYPDQQFPEQLSENLTNLLAFVPFDNRYNIEKIYNKTETYVKPDTIDRLSESFEILAHSNLSLSINNNKLFNYALLSWRKTREKNDIGWQPLVQVIENRENLDVQELVENNLADEEILDVILCANGHGCDDIGEISDLPIQAVHIVTIVISCFFLTLLLLVIVILVRRHFLNRRMSKGPYKIILTASDFVFPQVVDSRRVDEGIEAMLCCWLQQFQEFGGPEVEKPDLLQGSVGSLKPHLKASTSSLARHTIFKDPRARYNGDLVQLKELPCQGTFELKSKAMDVLVMIHGLRHENLNPLIGCLNEPTRPCLVYEYCSRGSLEDVLVQDEIKLDWSFRLSLLTDLVRGMKYLHSSPIRVHGYLTSRNCVIDARWVLKVTDYGLPAFYETQNIIPPAKSARDLLWTAPELLRHTGLRKKGTQPGDVYSFGIIMQEVVVRGEPFCMLALSPEDIVEKVKKPPPLIRPSVSKGAAPPEAINIMRQCWAEAADMRPDFNAVHDLFKKLNHGRKVNFVDTMFQMLEKYSNNLEELIRERTEQLDMEKKKTEQLLNRMLPSSVAEKLKLGMPVDPEEFEEVTIYFSDIVGFTTISAHSTPFQVVDLLNDLYTCFDDTINAYTVYKVETIGDAYMVVGGCPVKIPDHATQIATMALDLLHQSGKFKIRHLPKTPLRLRIGLHTGPCCAGVVGLTMPRYCLFGDTVNTASRMESTGAPWRIHLSQATRDRLCQAGGYFIEYRGCTEVKGKGKMPTYWLLGKQGFDKPLPTPPPLGDDHGLDENLFMERAESTEQSEASEDRSECSAASAPVIRHQIIDELNAPVIEEDDNSSGKSNCSSIATCIISSKLNTSSTMLHERTSLRKVPVSVHDERKKDSLGTGLQGPSNLVSEVVSMPLSAVSTTSLSSISGTTFRGATSKYRRVGIIDEDDLSSPYNHYRCLSPNEHYSGKTASGRFLRRQFSLDRPDEPISIISDQINILTGNKVPPRIFKQNSAGAANDLEKIEEVPLTTPTRPSHQNYRHAASMSLSVESLTLH
ncbi:receptor-type guanylate cyclase gcy-12 isoform X3 [Chelonus insularis]|uniref:receptor-type guanylate cyclase gcy-12 isoform X3 n=1 Tax=Chelonus insularis TaxID=460826 RepID=UPI00158CCD88|nr:receptor-type guanylate cyclase gcy-12 isoform X3 [Chelonus insularis]